MNGTPFIRNVILASPLYLLAIVPFVLIAHYVEITVDSTHVLLGAFGWWIAFIIRLPVIFLIQKKKIHLRKASKITIGISGPAEEITRLLLLLIVGLTAPNAYSVGLGWAMIEIIYGLVQITGLGILEKKSDPQAEEAKSVMKKMGMDKTLEPSTPFWGALERVSSSALHIGLSLLLVSSPYLILVTIPLHSFTNFFVVKMNQQSIRHSQIGLLVLGCMMFILGLAFV
jgi:hypothetical protein